MAEKLYDLKINYVSPARGVKVYKEYKDRDIENLLYWINFFREYAYVISYEIREKDNV